VDGLKLFYFCSILHAWKHDAVCSQGREGEVILKVRYCYGAFYIKTDSGLDALYNLKSGSRLARANDTAANYAAIHCTRQRTILL